MNHDSQNNFRSYYRGYPFNGNAVDQAQASEETSDETVINAAHDQIEKILTMKPFDPEEFGFKFHKDIWRGSHGEVDDAYHLVTSKINCMIRGIGNDHYGYWEMSMHLEYTERTGDDRTGGTQVNIPLYIPNDLAGRIILTGLGIVPRRDLDSEGKGCSNDDNLDGICTLCESLGMCQNKLNVE